MVTAILSRSGRSEGVSLAVPVDMVLETALRLAEAPGRPLVRSSLGMVVREVDVHGAGEPGLVVTRFHERAPAQAAATTPVPAIAVAANARMNSPFANLRVQTRSRRGRDRPERVAGVEERRRPDGLSGQGARRPPAWTGPPCPPGMAANIRGMFAPVHLSG